MNTTVVQNLPLAFLVGAFCESSPCENGSVLGTSNVASLEWATHEEFPSLSFSGPLNGLHDPATQADEMLSFMAVAKEVMPEGRPLKDWEKEDVDEFVWSQFQ